MILKETFPRLMRILLLCLLSFYTMIAYSQPRQIVLLKKDRVEQRFWVDGQITFQTQEGQWQFGIIKRITADSFFLTKQYVNRSMGGIDTTHVSGFAYALTDILAVPSKKQMTVVNGGQVKVVSGREKLVWIRNGFLFRAAGASYAVVNITNNLLDKRPVFGKKNLPNISIAAAVFLIGQVLHWRYDPSVRISGKYRLEVREF